MRKLGSLMVFAWMIASLLFVGRVWSDTAGALLLDAAAKGDLKKVQELVDKGANVNEASKVNGVTPLIAACLNGRVDVVKYLLDKGAAVDTRTSFGVDALMAAGLNEAGYEKVSKLLFEKGAGASGLLDAAASGNLEGVKELVKLGTSVNAAAPATGETALMAAASNGQLEVVKWLLEKGADVNAKTARGITALMAAASVPDNPVSKDIVKLLIDKGADVNAKTASGKTALQFASFMNDLYNPPGMKARAKSISGVEAENEVSQILIDRGAK
jgi:ankyrin repeat protein